jgi:hypothetical protein
MDNWWDSVTEGNLLQGDFLTDCMVPVFRPDFGRKESNAPVPVKEYDLIVVTQSCDLVKARISMVALCPICLLTVFEKANPSYSNNKWEEVRKGRVEGLHLLASPEKPENNRMALVVNFREIYSLPFEYLTRRAGDMRHRWRLRSPYLEHFSQAFARFFMRVGLPSSIAPYK